MAVITERSGSARRHAAAASTPPSRRNGRAADGWSSRSGLGETSWDDPRARFRRTSRRNLLWAERVIVPAPLTSMPMITTENGNVLPFYQFTCAIRTLKGMLISTVMQPSMFTGNGTQRTSHHPC